MGPTVDVKLPKPYPPGRLAQSISRLRRRRTGLASSHAAPAAATASPRCAVSATASPMACCCRQRPPRCDAQKPASLCPRADRTPRYQRRRHPHGLPDGRAVLGCDSGSRTTTTVRGLSGICITGTPLVPSHVQSAQGASLSPQICSLFRC
jgi:hypothetical protein